MFSSRTKLKFLSDENFPKGVDELLRGRGHDVKKVSLGISDKQLSEIAKSESRVILTFDKHFLNKRLFPPKEHSGIVVLKISPPLIDTTFSLLLKLFEKFKPSEFKGRLFIISPFAFKIFPSLTKDLTK